MFKRKNIMSVLLSATLMLSNAVVFAQEPLPEVQPDLMGTGISLPVRNASSWALSELVDSDRYGLYKTEDLYKNDLRNLLEDSLKKDLLKSFTERLENSGLDKTEKPTLLAETKNSKTRGEFLRELYNILVPYEDEGKLGKDPIMYLNHTKIALGSGSKLSLDRNITTEEAILFTKRAIDYIYSENGLNSKGLMWKVENKGNTVYLLGSIHYGKPDLYPFRKEVLDNFSDSEMLYVEVDITNEEKIMKEMIETMEEVEAEMKKASKYQDGTTLESVIDKSLYSKINIIMNKYDIPKEEYQNFKIQGIEQKLNEIIIEKSMEDWEDLSEEESDQALEEIKDNELMNLLMEGPKQGMDFYFLDKAKTLNKKVGELESIKSQMELLFGPGGLFGDTEDATTKEDQIERLKEVLAHFDDEGNVIQVEEEEEIEDEQANLEFQTEMKEAFDKQLKEIEGMFDAIKEGNVEKLSKIFTESEGAELFGGKLLGERDKNMAKKISDLLEGEEGKTYFIVVGAAHFVVEGTIIDNLESMGYKIDRVK